jgi:hypothetical protein
MPAPASPLVLFPSAPVLFPVTPVLFPSAPVLLSVTPVVQVQLPASVLHSQLYPASGAG